ncbi:hypothetical protein GSI_09835 [Ganoderma sinense ZZ0214-1]|uniref:Ricin B lectin domain-containing protein n=1 Tax=Ganoderma sinense ZZ0214-1 TaxID=1077348 RepID=A0A2G8S2V3_9APHY|nr:hypothetical protein GSI_09835 [Ganoderma sinense ZZ0214-1]
MIASNRTYKLVNVAAGNVLDLSGSNNSLVVGGDWHAGDNQKWHVDEVNGGWMLRNIATGLYLGINGDAKDLAPAAMVAEVFHWNIVPYESDSSAFRLFVPNTSYNLDLYGGEAKPGTPVIIYTKHVPGDNQAWRFEEGEYQSQLALPRHRDA